MSIIINKYKTKHVSEGAGVLVNRVFGHDEVKEFDPFLMLDYFDVKGNIDSPGFPWHPHKGMETISYFMRGSGQHQDSMGNKGIIGEGELQWMSAGKGIMHQEMFGKTKDGVKGLQFWVNLPASEKLKEPEYQYIKKGEMKTVKELGSEVKVIAGVYKETLGVIDKEDRGITMLHINIEYGHEMSLTRAEQKNGFVFVTEGSGTVNGEKISSFNVYTLDVGKIIIKATSDLEIIYAEGTPINEPIVWYGPIVMNTRDEIIKTYKDIENGTFTSGDWHE